MTQPRSGNGFTLDDLAAIRVPATPAAWGDRIVYVLRRVDAQEKKTRSSLYAVAVGGGEPRRLTQGAFSDRNPQVDPRGRFVVFVSDRGAGEQIHRFDAEGGEARALTALPKGTIGAVAVSPDGARVAIAFTAGAPRDDDLPLAAALARGSVQDGAAEAPAAPETPAAPAAAGKSPVPRARIYTRLRNREDGVGWSSGARTHLWLVDAATGAARRLTKGARDFATPAWTPSGDAIVATATPLGATDPDLDSTRNDFVRVDPESGAVASIAKPEGAARAPAVSPKGDLVAYLLAPPDDTEGMRNPVVCVSPLAGGEPRALGRSLDRPALDMVIDDVAGGAFTLHPPSWSADGTRLTTVVTDRGSVRLYEQPVDGSGPGRYVSPEARAVSVPVALAAGGWAAVVGSRGRLSEIGRVVPSGEVVVLTAHNAEIEIRAAPRTPETVQIDRDGTTLSGYYLAPRGLVAGGRAPAILYIHGGPHVCYGERLFFEMQWLADAGFAVLYTNPRGSHSFGEAYSTAIHFHWGDPDAADQLAFADWLAGRPEVDPGRMGVAGGSYGGFMTLALCAATERFGAAVAQRGLYNWLPIVGSSDFGFESIKLFGGALPWDAPERYFAHSPIRLVDRVRTPMLVIHNEGDLRVGFEQGVELFNALKMRGVPTALVLFPEEDHGMSRGGRIDRRIERLRQIRGWFDAWLAPR